MVLVKNKFVDQHHPSLGCCLGSPSSAEEGSYAASAAAIVPIPEEKYRDTGGQQYSKQPHKYRTPILIAHALDALNNHIYEVRRRGSAGWQMVDREIK